MKKLLTLLFAALAATLQVHAQTRIDGVVSDEHGPLVGVNVFVVGTIDGAVTDTLGRFSFTTARTGELTLRAVLLGYEEQTLVADGARLRGLQIRLREQAASIDEVVVTASTYSMGRSSQIKTLDALDVVMAGNSCGDVVAALQVLPGTQKVGENGRLYVRGGDSEECQTFVNGMHVLVPYSTNVEGNAQRGRFSPFLFKGMSFSLGGYSGEYGQALSSVLPMETTDVASSDKFGISASLLDWNVGGTKAFRRSSLSFNADYTDLGLHNALFPDRNDWTRPYRKLSGEAQFKYEWDNGSSLKSYVGYDCTSLGLRTEGRELSLVEHNAYANATLQTTFGRGYRFFAGVEDYVRDSRKQYDATGYTLDYNLLAGHVDAQVRIFRTLFLNLSARAEKASYSPAWVLTPRVTLSFVPGKRFQSSIMVGRYSQSPEDDCLARGLGRLGQSTADHAILSLQYGTDRTVARAEAYCKRYRSLPLLRDGVYTPDGYGYSRGLDLFVEDASLIRNLTLTAAYSFNDSQRLYQDFDAPRTPSYASRHNLRVTAKYGIGKVIVGLADTYASGRVYQAGTTPFYNSLDANVTWLAHPKVIVYASLNNLLGRTNVYQIDTDGTPVSESRDRFFYIGIFVSLKNSKAYDIANF